MKFNQIATGLALCAALTLFTACGKTTINLNDYMEIEFTGYDGAGKAVCTLDAEQMVEDNPKAFGFEDGDIDIDDFSSVSAYVKATNAVEKGISYEVDPGEALANGDTVKLTWKKVSESLSEKYKVKFVYSDITATVSDLEEMKPYDPFEYVTVTFEGMAPNGKATINKKGGELDLKYDADKTEGLSNGDVITIKASAYTSSNLNEYANSKGMIVNSEEKQYTVEGLNAYVRTLDEIPSDMMEKMKAQGEDSLNAYFASSNGENETLTGINFIGCYFLTGKEGFNVRNYNKLYLVYKADLKVKGRLESESDDDIAEHDVTLYSFYKYTDLVMLGDGTCSVDLSKGERCRNRVNSIYGVGGWWFSTFYYDCGYFDLDSMFSNCVTADITEYNYENTVKE